MKHWHGQRDSPAGTTQDVDDREGDPPSPKAARIVLHGAAHLALWAGLYVTSAVVFIAQLTGWDTTVPLRARLLAAAFALCTASGVYLLDRVKLCDRWLDPADAQAHPERFKFLSLRTVWVRSWMTVLLIAATWLGRSLHPWAFAVPPLAAAGVIVYAGRPRNKRPRVKDVLVLKNVYVAIGIAGFAVMVALIAAHPDMDLPSLENLVKQQACPMALAAILLAVRVFADAVLCDLDDEDADRAHGTSTLPTSLGRQHAWNIALFIRLGLAAALIVLPVFSLHTRWAWATVTVVSSLGLRIIKPIAVRDWVDARFAGESVLVTALLYW